MAKTGGWARKLEDKSKARATRLKLGTHNAMVARTRSTHHEKVVAFQRHKDLIHGFHRGNIHNEGGVNPQPRVTDIKKDGSERAVTFRGDGFADDSLGGYKPPKTTAERAKADKRPPLKGEMVEGWKPRRQRRYGYGSGCTFRPK